MARAEETRRDWQQQLGHGNVINTFLDVLIIAALQAGLAQIGASEPSKRVVTGLVIVAAVVLDAYRQRANLAEWLRGMFRSKKASG